MPARDVRRWAEARGAEPAVVLPGRTVSWAQLAELAAQVQLPADPLVFCQENSFELVVAIVAALGERRPFALLHPRLAPTEREEQREHFAAHVAQLPADTAAVLFTSGTSGRAKAACLSRRALVASAQASFAHLGAHMARWLLALPLCHVGGLSVLTRALTLGTALVMPAENTALQLLECVREQGVTGASLVPTQLRRLVELGEPLQGFGVIVLGGAPAPQPLLEAGARLGARVLCTYGMTETCSQITLEEIDGLAPADGSSSGVLLGANAIEIRDETGRAQAAGEVGTLWVRGPSLFSGYVGRPTVLDADGWFETGDLGYLDAAGRLHVESRRVDLIVSGGENVYPLEVERVLLECPQLREALVFGAADDEWGQQVRALVVPTQREHDGAALLEQLAAHLAQRLGRHKWPKRVAVVSALPSTPLGKPDRRAAPRVDAEFLPLPRPR